MANRQPIALIGHDGLELGGGWSNPVSLPPVRHEANINRGENP